MDLEADFWHGKVKTYLVSYKLFKFYAKPKKSHKLQKSAAKGQIFENGLNQLIFWAWHKI